jgi:hypothetical protein
MAGCVRWSFIAAFEKLRSAATVRKTRNSLSSMDCTPDLQGFGRSAVDKEC